MYNHHACSKYISTFPKLSARHEYIHDHFKRKKPATCSEDISSERFPYVAVVSRPPLNKSRMFLLTLRLDIETALERKSNVCEKLVEKSSITLWSELYQLCFYFENLILENGSSQQNVLTFSEFRWHLWYRGLIIVAHTLQTTFSRPFPWRKVFDSARHHCYNISSITGHTSSLVQIVAWHRIGNKPLCKPMKTLCYVACMCHWLDNGKMTGNHIVTGIFL